MASGAGDQVDPSPRRTPSSARMTVQRSKGVREMPTTTATRIGFVGLGHMCGTMAARFLAAGLWGVKTSVLPANRIGPGA